MARRRAGLADLVEVRHEAEHRLAFAAEVDQRLAAAQRGLRRAQEPEDQLLGLGGMRRAVGLLLGPAGAGDEQQLGVRTDGLLVGLRTPRRRARWSGSAAPRRRSASTVAARRRSAPRRDAAGVEQHDPRPLRARQHGLHALAVEPAGDGGDVVPHRERGRMRVDAAAQAVRHAGQRARPSRRRRARSRSRRPHARQRASAAAASVAYRGCGESFARDGEESDRAACARSGRPPACVVAPASPTVTSPPSARAAARASSAGLARLPSASVCARNKYRFHVIPPRSTATISRAISSAGMFLTTRVSRCCFGRLTDAKHSPVFGIGDGFGALQRGHDAAHVRHPDLRIVARFRQMARWPSRAPPAAPRRRTAGGWPPSIALEHFEAAVLARDDLVDALELLRDAEPLADHLHGGPGAARGGFPAAEDQQARRGRGRGCRRSRRPARRRSRTNRQNPEAGPSSATSSNGTFCATVIMTCCSLALGPRLTSQTLLPAPAAPGGRLRRARGRPRGRAPRGASFRSSERGRRGL